MPAARQRRDGEPTADELKARGQGAGPDDEALTIDWQKVGGTTPGQPAGTDVVAASDEVAERQADAVSDSAPPAGGPPPAAPADEGANRLARLEIVKAKFTRLDEIAVEKKALTDEEEEIRTALEKESGFQRSAVSSVRKIKGLGSAAAMRKHIENRDELESIFIKPILDEADAGQSDEK